MTTDSTKHAAVIDAVVRGARMLAGVTLSPDKPVCGEQAGMPTAVYGHRDWRVRAVGHADCMRVTVKYRPIGSRNELYADGPSVEMAVAEINRKLDTRRS